MAGIAGVGGGVVLKLLVEHPQAVGRGTKVVV